MTTVADRLDELITPAYLSKFSKGEVDQLSFFSQFIETLIVIEGKKGSGKTQLAISILKNLDKYFEVPTITDQRLKSEYGPYHFLDEKIFINEITKISDVSKGTTQEEVDLAVEWSLKKQGIILEGAALFLDEAYKYFDCRTPTDKLVRIFGYFIAQMRHYHCTVILCTPSRRYLDRRVKDQIDYLAKVAYNRKTETVHARFLSYMTGEVIGLRVYGPNYRDLYNSWGPISLRKKVLDLRGSM